MYLLTINLIGRRFTQMIANFLVMNRKRCTKIRLTMLCLSGFEPYSRWVPLV